MPANFALEEFESPAAPQADEAPTAPDNGPDMLEAYESGYKSGWDDASAAMDQEKSKVGAELARNLRDLGFTYHEARSNTIKAMEALLEELVEKVLPQAMSDLLARQIIEDIMSQADAILDAPVQVVVSPAEADMVRDMLPDTLTMPVEVLAEPTQALGQAYLKFAKSEHRIDLAGVLDRMQTALKAMSQANKERTTG